MTSIVLLVFLLSVPVGGAFGEAAAEGAPAGDGLITVDLEVEVAGATSVVAHIIDPGDEQITLAMHARTGSVFATSSDLERADLVVVFEVLDGDEVVLSRPLSLSELGVDPAVLGAVVAPKLLDAEAPVEPSFLTPEIQKNLWLAVALGAAALSLLAVWAAGPKSQKSEDDPASLGDAPVSSGD